MRWWWGTLFTIILSERQQRRRGTSYTTTAAMMKVRSPGFQTIPSQSIAGREKERDDSPPGVAVRRPLNSPLLARPSISTVRVIKSERSILQRCDTPCVQRHEEVGKAWAKKANALERARESRREYRRVCVCVCVQSKCGWGAERKGKDD